MSSPSSKFEFKVHMVFSDFDENPDENVSNEHSHSMAQILKWMQRRYSDKLYVTDFPLCQATGRLNPVQIKSEIDKICLLCTPLPYVNEDEKAFLKAMYIITNYLSGCHMSENTRRQFVRSKSASDVAKHIKVTLEKYSINSAELRDIIAEVVNVSEKTVRDRIKDVNLDDFNV